MNVQVNVQVNFKKQPKVLIPAREVPIGKVYSWGAMQVSYLRVDGGSVSLDTTHLFLPLDSMHFSQEGPRVEIAAKADLTIEYEG